MSLLLIILGAVALIIGMLLAMKNMKPMYFVVIAAGIVIVGTAFGVFGTLFQSQESDKGSKELSGKATDLQKQVKNLEGDLSEKMRTYLG
jgi:membrane protein implicated in regulation of membrane protease activity